MIIPGLDFHAVDAYTREHKQQHTLGSLRRLFDIENDMSTYFTAIFLVENFLDEAFR